MDTQYISVFKVHEYVTDAPPSTVGIQDRIIAQKVIYLANELGINCGDFIWSWYKKGPYSPALTRVMYANQTINADEMASYVLRDESKQALKPLREITNNKPKEIRIHDWLELLASVHYIFWYWKCKDYNHVANELILQKPRFSREQVKVAYYAMDKYGFLT
ncbi:MULTISPECIES: hypothetical protein [Brevibacillus]|uniref:hypothetical protein n=1 Tax=Brevibacillus TaxID=55080 RepID=UPI000D0F2345|nr:MULTISPECIES: hypothetical protein [Brevibacillus]MED1947087.1 hypothetical protein [Brevibacillus formosus]MED2000437.1 hypothetical protein [Brevibacillus formosus]MED2085774.1 hypothetical protein [Brevibacillus formosus]PSK13467.1 hypothetical protein C7R94_22550 [Brevibacillus sp. NRRL NRS-603]